VSLRDVLLFLLALLAIVNPVGSAVLFTALAGRFEASIQRRMANQSAMAVLIVLIVTAWLGKFLLQIFGVTVPMLQAAGGLILLRVGMQMVSVEEARLTPAERSSIEEVPESHWKTLSVVPLAIPGAVGAGAITTVVIQASTYNALADLAIITGVSLVVSLIVWVAFRSAGTLGRRLGPIGLNIVTRLMGILVTAIAFGLLGHGLGGLLPGLAR
jgi:multiple antibiotic resistance protein